MRTPRAALLCVVLSPLPAVAATSYTITTYGGGGPDGIPALEASFNTALGLAADAAGNVYITETHRGRVYRMDPSGILHVLAGSGATEPYPGCCPDVHDGGPAREGSIGYTPDVVLDGAGNAYIADEGHRRVRRVDAVTGIITTVAGTGEEGFSGDGGPAVQAMLSQPSSVAVDASGNVFVADDGTHRVRRIDVATGIITTVAGNGGFDYSGDDGPAILASFRFFGDIILDAAGNLFISDYNNDRVRRVDAATGTITTYAGGGTGGDGVPARESVVRGPQGLAFGPGGDLFVNSAGRIKRVDASTSVITTWAEPGFGGAKQIVFDSAGDLLVSEFLTQGGTGSDVLRIDGETGEESVAAGTGDRWFCCDGLPATGAALLGPFGIALGPGGDVFVSDTVTHRVRRISRASGLVSTVAGNGLGGFNGDGILATSARLNTPLGLALNRRGSHLFIADFFNRRVRAVDLGSGLISTVAGIGSSGSSGDGGAASLARLNGVTALAVDADDNLYISDPWNSTIRRVDLATKIITRFAGNGTYSFSGDGGPAVQAGLDFPAGIAFDPDGNLLIADAGNSRIRMVDVTGTISTLAGDGSFGYGGDGGPALLASFDAPNGVATDSHGNIFVADTFGNRMRRIDGMSGIVETIAGTGEWGFGGDDGPATEGRLGQVAQLALDFAGHVYLADVDNNRVRVLSPSLPPATIEVRLDPEILWPPDRRLWDVQATVAGDGPCPVDDVTLASIDVTDSGGAPRAGRNHSADVRDADFGTPDFSFLLRAERAGPSSERLYTITYTGVDCEGRRISGDGSVRVPRDQRSAGDEKEGLRYRDR